MFKKFLTTVFLVLVLSIFQSDTVFALGSGGFRNEAALDAEANGMALAVCAKADSASAVHFNPAGLVQLKGDHVKIGYTYQAPRNSFTDPNGNESQMLAQSFFIPNLYYASDLGSEKWRFGLSVTSPYGLATDWADDSFSRRQATESNLEFYQINPAVAYKIDDIFSIAFGIDYMTSYIEKHKRIAAVLGGGDFLLKGNDDGWGYNIGFLMRPSEKHQIGLSYRSKIELTYEGLASLDGLNALAQALYSFAGASYSTDIESKLTLPRTLVAGYAFRPNEKWTVEFDLEWTGWSSIEEDFVRYTSEGNTNRLTALNDGNPASKDWNDTLAYGIGAEYQANDKLALRGGYLFYQTPIPAANFETALPDSDRHGFTFGAGYDVNDSITIDMAYIGVLFKGRVVTNDVRTAAPDIDGEYEGYANVVSVGFTYKY